MTLKQTRMDKDGKQQAYSRRQDNGEFFYVLILNSFD